MNVEISTSVRLYTEDIDKKGHSFLDKKNY